MNRWACARWGFAVFWVSCTTALAQEPASEARSWVDRAMAEAQRIESRPEQAEALGTIAGAIAELGDRQSYDHAVQMAMAGAKETDQFTLGATMWSIAESQARAGDAAAAVATAEQAGTPVYVALSLAAVADVLAQRGKAEDARRAIEAARQRLAQIDDPYDQSWASHYLAEAHLELGDVAAARATAEACADPMGRAETLAAVAEHLASQGDADAADQAIAQAQAATEQARRQHDSAGAAPEASHADFALAKLAEAQARLGRFDAARRQLEPVSDASPRAWALARLATALQLAGQGDAAREAAEAADQAVRTIEDPYERAVNWRELAAMQMAVRPGEVQAWVDAMPTALERAYASLGVADEWLRRDRAGRQAGQAPQPPAASASESPIQPDADATAEP